MITHKHRGNVLVIGAGVSGLTCALCLSKRGFNVTVVAAKFAPDVTSVIAGALWEWPPAVCGYHHDSISLTRSKDWCMVSYRIFEELSHVPSTGVFMRPAVFYFRHPVTANARDLAKMNELRHKVRDFVHDAGLIDENGVNINTGVMDAYTHLAPMIDTDIYMQWLLAESVKAGCRILPMHISGNLSDQEAVLKAQFDVSAIVNCAGLGSAELAAESMYPLRGALIRVHNNGTRMPRITKAHCVSHDESMAGQDIVFIVPRGSDMLVLGGLAEKDQWGVDINLHNYEPIRAMVRRCVDFLPLLNQATIDIDDTTRVGLRPFRKQNVRLERQAHTTIIHNYGHGGAGVTFSWGCAQEVVDTAERIICS